MYCSQCGGEVSGSVRYCPACGARQETGVVPAEKSLPEEQEKEKKRQKAHRQGRRLGNFLVSVIALVILFAGDQKVPDASEHTFQKMDAAYFTVQNQREMAVCGAQGIVCTVDVPQKVLSSADKSVLAYIDRDRELYYMEADGPVFIDDGVKDAQISFYGDTAVYVREGADGREELGVRALGEASGECIAVTACGDFSVSPDGKTVAWVEEAEDGALYLRRPGGSGEKIVKNISKILGISDGGATVFCQRDDGRLCCRQDGRERLLTETGGNVSFLLNESRTEMLYTIGNSTWYYAAERESPVRLAGVKGNVLTDCFMSGTAYQRGHGLILGRKTLKNMAFATEDTGNAGYRVYYLDWNGERAETIFNHADQFQISGDGRSLLGLADGRLYRVREIQRGEDKVCLEENLTVRQFAASPDLQKIWFVTEDADLYSVKDQERTNLSSGLDQMYGYCGKGVLFREGGDLYLAGGDGKTLIEEGVDGAYIQENYGAILDLDGMFCHLKAAGQIERLISSR